MIKYYEGPSAQSITVGNNTSGIHYVYLVTLKLLHLKSILAHITISLRKLKRGNEKDKSSFFTDFIPVLLRIVFKLNYNIILSLK